MNWIDLLSNVATLMPKLLPNILRALADHIEQNPDQVKVLLERFKN